MGRGEGGARPLSELVLGDGERGSTLALCVFSENADGDEGVSQSLKLSCLVLCDEIGEDCETPVDGVGEVARCKTARESIGDDDVMGVEERDGEGGVEIDTTAGSSSAFSMGARNSGP